MQLHFNNYRRIDACTEKKQHQKNGKAEKYNEKKLQNTYSKLVLQVRKKKINNPNAVLKFSGLFFDLF